MVSSAETFCRSDHPVCAIASLGASTPPLRALRGGELGGDVDVGDLVLFDLAIRCIYSGRRNLLPLSRRLPSLGMFAVLVKCVFDGHR